jgi:hypothetical protein
MSSPLSEFIILVEPVGICNSIIIGEIKKTIRITNKTRLSILVHIKVVFGIAVGIIRQIVPVDQSFIM